MATRFGIKLAMMATGNQVGSGDVPAILQRLGQ